MTKRALVTATAALVFALMLVEHASATTLTFDDISSATIGFIPDGYGGLDWDEMAFINGELTYTNSGYENGTVSGDYVAFNNAEAVATASGTVFDFNSAYLTGAWNNGLNITVRGFLGASQLYSQTVVVNTTGPTLFNFNYLGVDRVTFASFGGTNAGLGLGGTHFAMDDFTFTTPVQSVPESASPLVLLCCGLLGITVFVAAGNAVRS